jgi:hypothetical protein
MHITSKTNSQDNLDLFKRLTISNHFVCIDQPISNAQMIDILYKKMIDKYIFHFLT